MELSQRADGAIVAIDHTTGLTFSFTAGEMADFHSERKNSYTSEWRNRVREDLTPMGLSEVSICLLISGRFDHNKRALERHLKRVNKEHFLERIWLLIK